jgi:F-type H+-transporting ATPase subunit c
MRKHFYLAAVAIFSAMPAFAQEAAATAVQASTTVTDKGLGALAAALALGIAALGGGLAQGKIGASAMEGLARNPQARSAIFVPMIIALVFVETLVLFTFALSFLLQNKI